MTLHGAIYSTTTLPLIIPHIHLLSITYSGFAVLTCEHVFATIQVSPAKTKMNGQISKNTKQQQIASRLIETVNVWALANEFPPWNKELGCRHCGGKFAVKHSEFNLRQSLDKSLFL
mmetsp:Transcript_2280/g.4654  ORF Transcript_2280/g.4654 Transcript_2280/m.4654 type:complete len:117 (-) Transcript_2280:1533-1883(-)